MYFVGKDNGTALKDRWDDNMCSTKKKCVITIHCDFFLNFVEGLDEFVIDRW